MLQLIDFNDSGDKDEDLRQVITSLKELTKEFNTPIIVLSQLRRDIEKRDDKRPKLDDLKIFGNSDSMADLVLFLYSDEYYNPDTINKNIAELIVAKNNNGLLETIKLFFEPDIGKFYEL